MLIQSLIIPWILTILIEFIIIWIFIRKNPEKLLFYSLIINSITLPLATFIYIYFFHNFLSMEIAIILVETFLLKIILELKYEKAVLISLIANFISALVGILIYILF
ncbi:MAG: hypothetical protein CVV28_02495 [Methanobacteriales archaeon HGW-Methanobacteriales-1]|nr:MAG: hypothetical protein CVV28_02495 [Methanobacteriales archaeon HGW-Methanobacteriales-1]